MEGLPNISGDKNREKAFPPFYRCLGDVCDKINNHGICLFFSSLSTSIRVLLERPHRKRLGCVSGGTVTENAVQQMFGRGTFAPGQWDQDITVGFCDVKAKHVQACSDAF